MLLQQPLAFYLPDNGIFPNSRLPAILYRGILQLPFFAKGRSIRNMFNHQGWSNSWDAGVFTYHHYHSTTHEALGFYRGQTDLQLGGENGPKISVTGETC